MAGLQIMVFLLVSTTLGVLEGYRYSARNLGSFSSLRNYRERRSESEDAANEIYIQDLLAPFFSNRRLRSNFLEKRDNGNTGPVASLENTNGCQERSGITYTSPTTATVNIRFPGVQTTKDDSYRCTGYKIPFENQESFIVKFTPHADMDRTHHMLVYGCSELYPVSDYQQCYEPCQNKQTLYAWARNAPELTLPKDVGYSIGGNSGIRFIAVQMHFANAFDEPSCSGVSAEVTLTPQANYAGIFLLGSPQITLPPHSTNVPSTVACINAITDPMHVFAFRTHAHSLANVITGYRYHDSLFKMIGKGNPKWPQSFYPRVGGEIVLEKGDVLTAQCIYNNTRDVTVRAGPGGSDEMCNLYLMFYTPNKKVLKEELECWGVPAGYKASDIKLPEDSLDLPPYPGYAGEDSINAIAEGRAVVPPVPDEHMHHHHAGGDDEDEVEGNQNVGREGGSKDESKVGGGRQENLPGIISDDELDEKLKQLKTLLNESEPLSRSHGMPEYQGLQADLSYPELQGSFDVGAVGGLVADHDGSVYVFHRAGRLWNATSFDSHNRFTQPHNPIMKDTIYHLEKTTGEVLHSWGSGRFFMPHGASLDHEGNLWLTDVAMHQVFKYPKNGANEPLMALGVRMVPGSDINHFCKPTDVAVDTDGTIYVSDGYCNGRVMKFSYDGLFIKQWGRMVTSKDLMSHTVPPNAFFVAHNIILCGPDKAEVCVADRENGRIQCFTKEGSLTRIIEDKEKTGTRIFAITYSPLEGGVIYGVNGPDKGSLVPSGGFSIHYDTGAVMKRWQPAPDTPLKDPHDISASPDGLDVYVGDLTHKKVFKFYDVPSALPDMAGVAFLSKPEGDAPTSGLMDKKSGPLDGAERDKKTDVKDPPTESEKLPSFSEGVEVREYPEKTVPSSAGSTVVIACLVVLPTVVLLLAIVCIRIRERRLKEYESLLSPNGKFGKSSLNLGKFLKPTERRGFTRVSSEGSDDDEDGDSDVEVYSKTDPTLMTADNPSSALVT